MTIQEQADAILGGWQSHETKLDELLVRLAQDRMTLLLALKDLRQACASEYAHGRISAFEFVQAGNAIAEAEAPR